MFRRILKMKKEETEVRYRMFCLVPYNISEIQKGIQALHGVVEYQLEHGKLKPYKQWAEIEKTVIILNGGTTGKNSTMLEEIKTLKEFGINYSLFHEPDLNDALTSINFILPSTVYNIELPYNYRKIEIENFSHNEKIKIWLSKFKLA